MPQKDVVSAFRKRLSKLGYTDISIVSVSPSCYRVTAVEPLGGCLMSVKYDLSQISKAFRRVNGSVVPVYDAESFPSAQVPLSFS